MLAFHMHIYILTIIFFIFFAFYQDNKNFKRILREIDKETEKIKQDTKRLEEKTKEMDV